MNRPSFVWVALVVLLQSACSDDAQDVLSKAATEAGGGGYGAGSSEGGTTPTGGSGGAGGGLITDSAFPKVASQQWGWASVAWLAEFDWVLLPWSARAGIAAKDINPDLRVTTTRETNACRDYLGGNPCPVEWRMRDADGNYVNSYGSDYLADTTDYQPGTRCTQEEGHVYT